MTQLDIDETRSRLRIGLRTLSDQAEVEAELFALGIPSTALQLHRAGPAQLQANLDSKFRPVPGGVRIEAIANLGCTFTVSVQRSTGLEGFLTASHCAGVDNMGSVSGQEFDQPKVAAGNTIGAEFSDPPFNTGTQTCGGTYPKGCRMSDATFVLFDPGIEGHHGTIARTTGLGSRTIDSSFQRFLIQRAGALFSVGDTLHKMGHKTGWPKGAVVATCVNTANDEGHLFLCQHHVAAASEDGDSGGTVFSWDGLGDAVDLVGLQWGGKPGEDLFYFSEWDLIVMDFAGAIGDMDVTWW